MFITMAPSVAVLDRAAVIVGNDVITESEIMEEIRVTAFLNREPPDLSPASRREAAGRLVDQALIRREMKISSFTPPGHEEAESMLHQFRREHFGSVAQYRRALETCGVSEAELQEHLLWQLSALRFTDMRFRAGVKASELPNANREAAPQEPPPVRAPSRGSAERSEPETGGGERNASMAAAATLDQRLDAWLKLMRETTRIEYKAEAFQ